MNRMTKSFGVTIVMVLMSAAGFACWQPHFTHTSAESPLFFENALAGGQAIFNKNIYPGTMCVGALNDGDDFKFYMDVGDSSDLLILGTDGTTYYSVEDNTSQALAGLKEHIKIQPYVDPDSLTITVDTNDPQHPIFSFPTDELFTYGEGTIYEVKILARTLVGNTVTIKRESDSKAMPDARIGYVRQGGSTSTKVTMTDSNLTDEVAANFEAEVTFNRDMGAIYAAFVEDVDPVKLIPVFACDRVVSGSDYTYKFCLPSNVHLEEGHTYNFGFIQECDGDVTDTAGCESGMALTQDMSGNAIDETDLPDEDWQQGDISDVTPETSDLGLNVIYREVSVPSP